MLNVTEITASTEERVLTGVKASQALMLDGLKNAMALAGRVIPENVSDRIEDRAASVPSAAPIVTGAFVFTGKLLDAHRDFVGEVVEIFQPAPAPKPAAKKPVAKKPAKKSAKKAA